MSSLRPRLDIQKHEPINGDYNLKSSLAYQVNRGIIHVFNTLHMGLAEAYINGLEVPDFILKLLFDTTTPIIIRFFPSLFVPYEWVLEETDHIAEGTQDLMKVQYNLPQNFFRVIFGESPVIYPKYTMALWEKGASNLEQAQIDMLDDLIEKLGIKDGDNILDVGCGWGCVPNYILSQFSNVRVTGLNLSSEQCNYIRHKMQAPESQLSSERFTLYEGDFNDAKFETKFDKIISLGFFEHIGNLTKAFQNLASFLKDDGKVFIHIMTIRTPHNVSSVFTHKYIFPHGRFWNYDEIPRKNKHLKTIQRWYMNGNNYSRTYKEWLKNFDDNQATLKDLNYGMDYNKFRRIWRFYLLWFSRNFAMWNGEYNGNGQYLLEKTS